MVIKKMGLEKGGAGRQRACVPESEAVPGDWRSPGQVTKSPASSLRDLSPKRKPARPNRKAEIGPMTLDEAKQGE